MIRRTLAAIAFVGCLCMHAGAIEPNSTFCNPININYQFNGGSRDAGDGLVIIFKGDYYLFVSHSDGYWWSTDLSNWIHVRVTSTQLPIINNWAPAVYAYNNRIYFSANDVSGFYSTDDPKDPTRWTKASDNAGSWDGCVFQDDDGTYYMTGGCGGGAYQMDPATGARIGSNTGGCSVADVSKHGFEQHVSSPPGSSGFCEGAWQFKRNNRYYFCYSVPGTEFDEYADGMGTSTQPISGYQYCMNSPVAFKPTGFIAGAGHGSVFVDKSGTWWRTSTMTNEGLNRRIGFFPFVFDDTINSGHAEMIMGDYPQYAPGKRPAGAKTNLVGWMLLSYAKPATASSSQAGHDPSSAFDESIHSFWSATSGNSGEWLRVDLQRACMVNAVQTNFADHELVQADLPFWYIQYKIESSLDGQTWSVLVDKSQVKTDLAHDYVQLPVPVSARYLKITVYHASRGGKIAISGLRVFGTDNGSTPAKVTDFSVNRSSSDRRVVTVTWRSAARAEGYLVRYGIGPNLMHNAYQLNLGKTLTYPQNWIQYNVHDTTITFSSLNTVPTYYFSVDAFNGSGVTSCDIIKSDGGQVIVVPSNSFEFSTDTLLVSGSENGANPTAAMTLVNVVTASGALPALSASSQTAWIGAAVNGTGNGQSIGVTANISGMRSGIYFAQVTVSGTDCAARSFTVKLRVNGTPRLDTIVVSPLRATILPRQTLQFTAEPLDQFGAPFPGTTVWSVNRGGTINQQGFFVSGNTEGTCVVTAGMSGSSVVGTASCMVAAGNPLPPGFFKNMLRLRNEQNSEYLMVSDAAALESAVTGAAAPTPSDGGRVTANAHVYTWSAQQSGNGVWADNSNQDNFVAFGALWVVSPVTQSVKLSYLHDDDLKIWVNGQLVVNKIGYDNGTEEISSAFSLSQGGNLVIVKLVDGCCGNHFALRLIDTTGGDIPGLVCRLFGGAQAPVIADAPAQYATAPQSLEFGPGRIRVNLTGCGAFSVEVCDLSGARLRSISGNNWSVLRREISTSGLSAGIYVVRLRDGSARRTARFVVAR